jgi:hypothetical protein
MGPRSDQVRITDNNLGPVIDICTVVLIVPMVIAVGGRIFTKAVFVRKVAGDDILIFGAFLLSLGQNAAVIIAVANGLGQHWEALDISRQTDFQKVRFSFTVSFDGVLSYRSQSTYVSALLLILTLVTTKLSIISFIQSLAPSTGNENCGFLFGAILILWGFGSAAAALFQCSAPDIWRQSGNKCFTTVSFHVWASFSGNLNTYRTYSGLPLMLSTFLPMSSS